MPRTVTLAEVVCCVANWNMLPCKQKGCCWHLVYLDCSLSYNVATSYLQKSTKNVQDCILSRRIVRQLVQSDDGLRRSPADGARPHRDTQRRPSLFRPLIPMAAALERPSTAAALSCKRFLSDLWPRFPGAIFFAFEAPSLDGSDDNCDKMSAPPVPRNNRLRSGISHT